LTESDWLPPRQRTYPLAGLAAQIVKHDEYRFLVDCGEGTQRQIMQSGAGFKNLNRILLTHGHLDHILGLAGLLSTFMRWEAIDEVQVYGGRSTLDRVEDLIYRVVLRGARPHTRLSFIDVKPGKIVEDDSFELSAFPVSHRGSDAGAGSGAGLGRGAGVLVRSTSQNSASLNRNWSDRIALNRPGLIVFEPEWEAWVRRISPSGRVFSKKSWPVARSSSQSSCLRNSRNSSQLDVFTERRRPQAPAPVLLHRASCAARPRRRARTEGARRREHLGS